MKPVIAQVEGTVAAARERVFDVFAPIDLRQILTGYGPLPAVAAVEAQQGAWDRAGQSRVIRLADGSSMREELTRVERPSHFAYTITELSGPLARLTSVFHGAWWFTEAGERTHARWQYRFEPRSAWLRPPTLLVVRGLWQPYMARALTLAAHLAELEG